MLIWNQCSTSRIGREKEGIPTEYIHLLDRVSSFVSSCCLEGLDWCFSHNEFIWNNMTWTNEIQCLLIPQLGVIRSLNVHVSASICLWEYTRQHGDFAQALYKHSSWSWLRFHLQDWKYLPMRWLTKTLVEMKHKFIDRFHNLTVIIISIYNNNTIIIVDSIIIIW